MKYRQLGANGPKISAIGLGCMSFGGIFGPTDEATSLRCLDAAYDHGVNFLDTANIYGMGLSETVIGKWLGLRKPDVVIATKATIVTAPVRRFDNSETHLREELHKSLKRLGRDHVELFYIHRREAARPVEEVVESLGRMIDEGLIGGYGMSEIAPTTLRRANAVRHCMAVQNEYSLWTRLPELGLIQTCAELGTAFIPFSPLGRAVFGRDIPDPRTFAPGDFRLTIPRFHDPDWTSNLAPLTAFRDYAALRGLTAPALALAWILDQGQHLVPIPGTRTAENLADWVGAADFDLTAEDRSEIARILPVGWAWGNRYGPEQVASVEHYC
jgi:aryl-alcohol dehydrogenase-like predicted oxidoreductase